ncbi:unnamed protein product, partial [Closterium sp. NIES-54]
PLIGLLPPASISEWHERGSSFFKLTISLCWTRRKSSQASFLTWHPGWQQSTVPQAPAIQAVLGEGFPRQVYSGQLLPKQMSIGQAGTGQVGHQGREKSGQQLQQRERKLWSGLDWGIGWEKTREQ